MELIENQTLDQERALYGIQDTLVKTAPLTAPPMGKVPSRNVRMWRRNTAISTSGTPSGTMSA